MHDLDIQIVSTPPRVYLAGRTVPQFAGISGYLAYRGATWNTDPLDDDAEAVIEAAGRVCCQSWRNPRGRSRAGYVQQSVIERRHGSVLEHVWLNFLVADLPRSVQLELLRHREGTAFSFESQRFTDRQLRFVAPPAARQDAALMRDFAATCVAAARAYRDLLGSLADSMDRRGDYSEDATLRRTRIREAARGALPDSVGSDGMVSINARALRDIIEMCSRRHADAAVREFANALFGAAEPVLPSVFADVEPGEWDLGGREIAFAASRV